MRSETSFTSISVDLLRSRIEFCIFIRSVVSRTYAHNTSLSDPASEPHSFSLEGASAQIIDANQAAGEYVFEVRADARVLQFRTNQQQVAENWVKWVAACSSEKRYQDTLRQLMTIDEGDEDAESILQDPAALEKKISVEIVKMILSSYYDIIRKKLIDEIPKVCGGVNMRCRRSYICS